jgi:hypothetical protein
MPIEQIKTVLNFGNTKSKESSQKKLKKNPAVENILKNLVSFKPAEANVNAEAAKVEALYFGVINHSEGKKSEFPADKFVNVKDDRALQSQDKQSTTQSIAEEIAHKKVLYQYVISHVEIEELRAYIKTLSSPALLKSFEAALREKDQAEYKKFVEAACEFQMEEREAREANEKAMFSNTDADSDGHIIFEDQKLATVFDILESIPVFEMGLLLALAVEHKMHDEFVEIIDRFAEGISSHHREEQKGEQKDKSDVNSQTEGKKKIKFETPETEERLNRLVALLNDRFHALSTHEEKQRFCRDCLTSREMIKASQREEAAAKKVAQKVHTQSHNQLGL